MSELLERITALKRERDMLLEVYEHLRTRLAEAQQNLKAREDDNVLMAQERAKEVGQYERLCDTLRTRLAEAEKKLEWVTADYATTVDVLNLVKQQRDEAAQRGRAAVEAMGRCVVCSRCRLSAQGYLICRVCWDQRVEPAMLALALTPGALSAPPPGP